MGILDWLLPTADRKFAGAKQLFKAGNYSAALQQFQEIQKEHSEAFSQMAECLYCMHPNKQGEAHYQDCLKILEWQYSLPNISNRATFDQVLAKSYFDMATYQYHQATVVGNLSLSDLLSNIEFIKKAQKKGLEKHFEKLLIENHQTASIIYTDDAKKFERQNQLGNAIKCYQAALIHYKNITTTKDSRYFELVMREAICELKQGRLALPSTTDEILGQTVKSREMEDFCFRNAVLLLKSSHFGEAQKFIYLLPPFNLTTLYLKRVLVEAAQRQARQRLNELNQQVQALAAADFPVPETQSLLEIISSEVPLVTQSLPAVRTKLQSLQFSLFSKLIAGCFASKRYQDIFNLIIHRPVFWESAELLKNLAGACLGMVSNQQISPDSYQLITSTWLTALHQPDLFLYTIEQTNWHVNAYQFTLIDSIGVVHRPQSALPEEINYQEASSLTISVGAAQRSLLTAFEAELTRIPEELLPQEVVQRFYDDEKKALQNLLVSLPEAHFPAAPTFAHRFNCCDQLIQELSDRYSSIQDDSVLLAGLPYIIEDRPTAVNQYAEANRLKNSLLTALSHRDSTGLQQFQNKSISLFSFQTLTTGLEKSIEEWISRLIDAESKDDALALFLKQVVDIFPEMDTVKYRYTEYVTVWCLDRLNQSENPLAPFDGLVWFAQIYHLNPDNSRICENLVALIYRNLTLLMVEKATNSKEVFQILDKIEENQSNIFSNRAQNLAELQDEVLNSLNPESRTLIIKNTGLSEKGELWAKCLRYTSVFSGKTLE